MRRRPLRLILLSLPFAGTALCSQAQGPSGYVLDQRPDSAPPAVGPGRTGVPPLNLSPRPVSEGGHGHATRRYT
jgi:hypothetical protein